MLTATVGHLTALDSPGPYRGIFLIPMAIDLVQRTHEHKRHFWPTTSASTTECFSLLSEPSMSTSMFGDLMVTYWHKMCKKLNQYKMWSAEQSLTQKKTDWVILAATMKPPKTEGCFIRSWTPVDQFKKFTLMLHLWMAWVTCIQGRIRPRHRRFEAFTTDAKIIRRVAVFPMLAARQFCDGDCDAANLTKFPRVIAADLRPCRPLEKRCKAFPLTKSCICHCTDCLFAVFEVI